MTIHFNVPQFGGSVGGAIIKNKLFFFTDGERTKQDGFTAVSLAGSPFATLSGGFSQPFRESNLLGQNGLQLRQRREGFLPLLVLRKLAGCHFRIRFPGV